MSQGNYQVWEDHLSLFLNNNEACHIIDVCSENLWKKKNVPEQPNTDLVWTSEFRHVFVHKIPGSVSDKVRRILETHPSLHIFPKEWNN